MSVIECIDETFGSAGPDRRVPVARLDLNVEDVTARDVLRFRIEAERERAEDSARLHEWSRMAVAERPDGHDTLNPGKVAERAFLGGDAGSEHPRSPRRVTVEALHRAACEQFQAGAFLLLVNGCQIEDLDQRVPLRTVNDATFLRLLPLQGG